MDSTTVAAIIALVGTLVSVITSFIAAKLTSHVERGKSYNDSVTLNRHDWITRMRNYISVMLAEARSAAAENKSPYSKEYFINRNEVLIRLILTKPYHILLKEQIERLDKAATLTDYEEVEKNIFIVAEPLLKTEWGKVQDEAKGGK